MLRKELYESPVVESQELFPDDILCVSDGPNTGGVGAGIGGWETGDDYYGSVS